MNELGRLMADLIERKNKETAAFWAKVGRDNKVAVERSGQLTQALGAQAAAALRDMAQKLPSG